MGAALLLLTAQVLAISASLPARAFAEVLAQAGRPRTIVVASGDTLELISARHGVTLRALIEANGLRDPGRLQVGQVLRLPPPGAVAIIRPGDTLEALAARYGVSVSRLQAANPALLPEALPVGGWLRLPSAGSSADLPRSTVRSGGINPTPASPGDSRAAAASAAAPAPPVDQDPRAEAALLLSSAERRDRADLALREASGLVQWKRFGSTQVDWSGWRLHPGGVRITFVRPAAADLGPRLGVATAVAVQCSTLRQTWRVDGAWQPWASPQPRTVAQRIVLDLCSNTLDGPAVPVPDVPATAP